MINALLFLVNMTILFFFLVVVYANTYHVRRISSWVDLHNLLPTFHGPWLFIGDTNSALGVHEKIGGIKPITTACDDFLLWSNANDSTHLQTEGAKYTWNNQRSDSAFIAQRLDRAISNTDWLTYWNICWLRCRDTPY